MNRRSFLKALVAGIVGAATAHYAPRELNVPIRWTRYERVSDDKIALIKQLIDNAIQTHDDTIEEALYRGAL